MVYFFGWDCDNDFFFGWIDPYFLVYYFLSFSKSAFSSSFWGYTVWFGLILAGESFKLPFWVLVKLICCLLLLLDLQSL